MNFPIVVKQPCISTSPPPQDPRCSDPAFALAHPDICSAVAVLIMKPGVGIVCNLGSIQFRLFVDQAGIETEVTDQATFVSSDTSIALVGAISGNATGVGTGKATIKGIYKGMTASAVLTVLAGTHCCDTNEVDTVILVDASKSMTLGYGDQFNTKFGFAINLASQFAGGVNIQKDKVALIAFDTTPTTVDQLTSNGAKVSTDALAETSTQNLTGIGLALQAAVTMLSASAATFKTILLISDGEDKDAIAADEPVAIAAAFKDSGGIIICCGVRAHDSGFNLLNAIATGGFFVNSYPPITDLAIAQIIGLKGFICAGNCTPAGDIVENKPALNYASLVNWDVIAGAVNLFGPGLFDLLPGNGLYVDLASGSAGAIRSKTTYNFVAGKTYRLNVRLAGNQRMALPGYVVRLLIGDGSVFQQDISMPDFEQGFQDYSFNFVPLENFSGKITVSQIINIPAGNIFGSLLDKVVLTDVTDLTDMLVDYFDAENPVYIPPKCGPSTVITSIVMPPTYDPGGFAYVTTLIPGKVYTWTRGVNEATFFDYGNGSLNGSGTFVPAFNTATLIGQPNLPVTGTITTSAHPGYYGYSCYGVGCLSEALGTQMQDPNPLPDIEAGYTPPIIYTSTKTAHLTCPVGSAQQSETSVVPVMTSPTAPTGTVVNVFPSDEVVGAEAWRAFGTGPFWELNHPSIPDPTTNSNCANDGALQYLFPTAKSLLGFSITPKQEMYLVGVTLLGSNGGFMSGDTLLFSGGGAIFLAAGVKHVFECSQFGSFLNFQLSFCSRIVLPNKSQIALVEFYEGSTAGVTKTATASSQISQADADAKALAAAQALASAALVCVHQYSSSQTYTAQCPVGQFGLAQTRSATATSFVIQQDADAKALAAAQAAAQAALDCTQSNNTSLITIKDSPNNQPFAATPYPSVKFVSGLVGAITRIRVNLLQISHNSEEDIMMVLMSPTGKKVCLMFFCGGIHSFGPIDVTFDSNSVTAIPQIVVWTAGSFKPTQYGVVSNLASPGPAGPYLVDFSTLLGDNPNGSWALFVCDTKSLDTGTIANGWTLQIN